METTSLAARAISLISTYLTNVASGTAESTEDGFMKQLHALVAERLRQTPLGAAVMDGLEALPADGTRQQLTTTALDGLLGIDPDLERQVDRAVTVAQKDPLPDSNSSHTQVDTGGGNLTMTDSGIAGRDVKIDKSRNLKIGSGVAAAVIALTGAGFLGHQIGQKGGTPTPAVSPAAPADPMASLVGYWGPVDPSQSGSSMVVYQDGTAAMVETSYIFADGGSSDVLRCNGQIRPVQTGVFRFDASCPISFIMIMQLQNDGTLSYSDPANKTREWKKAG